MKSEIEKPIFSQAAVFGSGYDIETKNETRNNLFFHLVWGRLPTSFIESIDINYVVKECYTGKIQYWKMSNDKYASISSKLTDRNRGVATLFIAFDINTGLDIVEKSIEDAQNRCIGAKTIHLVCNTDDFLPEIKEQHAKQYKDFANARNYFYHEYSAKTGYGIKIIEDSISGLNIVSKEEVIEKTKILMQGTRSKTSFFYTLPQELVAQIAKHTRLSATHSEQDAERTATAIMVNIRDLICLKEFIAGPEYNNLGRWLLFTYQPKHIKEMQEAKTFEEIKTIAQRALKSESQKRDSKVTALYQAIAASNTPSEAKNKCLVKIETELCKTNNGPSI